MADPFSMPFVLPDDAHGPVVMMHPSDFLRLAAPIAARIPSSERRKVIAGVLDAGDLLATIPELEVEIEGDDGFVRMHDGRHRALELLKRGFTTMPVHLIIEGGELDEVKRLYPQMHDDDDDYPGFDEDSLSEKAEPIGPDVILRPASSFSAASERSIPDRQPSEEEA